MAIWRKLHHELPFGNPSYSKEGEEGHAWDGEVKLHINSENTVTVKCRRSWLLENGSRWGSPQSESALDLDLERSYLGSITSDGDVNKEVL